jgi:hypothetical protein
LALLVKRTLWGFDAGAELDGECDATWMWPANWHVGAIEGV